MYVPRMDKSEGTPRSGREPCEQEDAPWRARTDGGPEP